MRVLIGCSVVFIVFLAFFVYILHQSATESGSKEPSGYKEPIPLPGVRWPVKRAEETFFEPWNQQKLNRKDYFIEAANGVPLSKLVQLSVFGPIRPGLTFEEALARYGKPTRTRKEEYSRIAVYEHEDARIEVEDYDAPTSFFGHYHRKSVSGFFKPFAKGCTPMSTILDPAVSVLISQRGRFQLHLCEETVDGDNAFVEVTDGCIKSINWVALDAESKKEVRELEKKYP